MCGDFGVSIEANEVLVRYLERGFFKGIKTPQCHFYGKALCLFLAWFLLCPGESRGYEDVEHEGK